MQVLLDLELLLGMRVEGSQTVLQLRKWLEEESLDRERLMPWRETAITHFSSEPACVVDLEKRCEVFHTSEIECI
jgi:hypothetical protein